MEQIIESGANRISNSSPDDFNNAIDQKTRDNILWYSREDPDVIAARMADLEDEWDIERLLILNAAVISLASILLGATKNRLWFIAPVVVSFFLGQQGVQGWCPPVALFRKAGLRTRREIDMEKYALMEALKSKQI
jgi:hypothetical protein